MTSAPRSTVEPERLPRDTSPRSACAEVRPRPCSEARFPRTVARSNLLVKSPEGIAPVKTALEIQRIAPATVPAIAADEFPRWVAFSRAYSPRASSTSARA